MEGKKHVYDLNIEEENINKNIDLSEDIKLIIDFLDYLKYIRFFSEKTIINYTIDMRQFLNYLSTTGIHLKEVTKKNLRKYLVYLHKEDFSNKSIHRKISSLKSLFKYLSKKAYIQTSPALTLVYPKLEKKLPEILSVNEVEELMDNFSPNTLMEKRDKAIVEILYSSGIRVSELTGLDIGDADLISKTIKVLGKGKKWRIAFLTLRAMKALREYLSIRDRLLEEVKDKSCLPKDERPLFISVKGTRLHHTSVYSIIKKYSHLISSGKNISPHTFRHSFATHLMNNGADIRLIQELLGHKNISNTQIYTHVSKDRLRDVYRQYHPHSKSQNK